jgi:predicted DNA-binding transcriptional regulator YafY
MRDQRSPLHRRLRQTRWPDTVTDSGWTYGLDLDWMKSIADYWLNQYDWGAQQRALNEYPHYIAVIDGFRIHYLHFRSKHANAVPQVITHGWPGSFLELLKAASMLADPSFPYTDDLKTAVAKVVAGANRRIGSSSAILSSASADEGPELQADTVAELTGAIERGKRVRFSYTGAEGKRSEREVEPWGLFARDGRWYAVAWDASAEGERVFAVSRMRDVVVNPSKPKSPDFERPSHFDVAEWMVLPFQYGPRTVEARLRFSGAAARRASALAAGQGRLETAGADVIWSVPVADESLLVRWILEHGPGIAVLEPVSVKETLAEGLAKVVRIHG